MSDMRTSRECPHLLQAADDREAMAVEDLAPVSGSSGRSGSGGGRCQSCILGMVASACVAESDDGTVTLRRRRYRRSAPNARPNLPEACVPTGSPSDTGPAALTARVPRRAGGRPPPGRGRGHRGGRGTHWMRRRWRGPSSWSPGAGQNRGDGRRHVGHRRPQDRRHPHEHGDARPSSSTQRDALHGGLGFVSEGDVVIAISNSGETEEILALLPYLRSRDHAGHQHSSATSSPARRRAPRSSTAGSSARRARSVSHPRRARRSRWRSVMRSRSNALQRGLTAEASPATTRRAVSGAG